MTFPVSGCCPRRGEFGIAVSSSPIVAAHRAHARAGRRRGREGRPVNSAGMSVVRDFPWLLADLHADWTGAPAELRTFWRPRQEIRLNRAFDPSAAPAFGVPGDP
ncbi:hypothetical protein ACFQU2_05820 [Siccirubricoccus deserti]|uniref:Uncharacterized protein n=1 Tax=Siccirubricoccus deserti TaxID=2013562 RepID=A0A9X0R4K9_9PROT|nr:hypothetical protein [Siccirubricoccus deserti]MBC4018930.1 hypothetical protein [Siccirubricoccus deserti]